MAGSSSEPPRPTSDARCPSRGSSPSRSHARGWRRQPDDLVFTSPGRHVLRNTNFRRRVFDPAAGKPAPGTDTARAAAHRGQPRRGSRREHQGGPADARARLGGHDPRRLRRALRGRPRCRRGPARPRLHEIECGPNADCKAPNPVHQGVLPFENTPNKPLARQTASEPPWGIEPRPTHHQR